MALKKFTDKKIGENIRVIRLSLHMSQEEFGKAAGSYSQDAVAKWEAGRVPNVIVLRQICQMASPPRSVDWMLEDHMAGGKRRKVDPDTLRKEFESQVKSGDPEKLSYLAEMLELLRISQKKKIKNPNPNFRTKRSRSLHD